MKAALFSVNGWAGLEKYLVCGETAVEILDKFQGVQDLHCLLMMGRMHEDAKGQKQLDLLETLLGKFMSGELTMQDLAGFRIRLKAGNVQCHGIAETEEEIVLLQATAPLARRI